MSSEYKGKISINTADLQSGAQAMKSFEGGVSLVSQVLAGDLVGAAGRAKEVLNGVLETFSKFKLAGAVGLAAAGIAAGFKLYEAAAEAAEERTRKFVERVQEARRELAHAFEWDLTPLERLEKAVASATKGGQVAVLGDMKWQAEQQMSRARGAYDPNDAQSVSALAQAKAALDAVTKAYDEAAAKQEEDSLKAHTEALDKDAEDINRRVEARQREIEASDKNAAAMEKQAADIARSRNLKSMDPTERVYALTEELNQKQEKAGEWERLGLGTKEDRAQMKLEVERLQQERDAAFAEVEAQYKENANTRQRAADAETDMAKAEEKYSNEKLAQNDPEARKKEIYARLEQIDATKGPLSLDQRKELLDLNQELDRLDEKTKKKPTKERGAADALQDLRDAIGAGTLSTDRTSHRGLADEFRGRLGGSFASHLQEGALTRKSDGEIYSRADTRSEQLAQEHNALLKQLITVTENNKGIGD